MAKQQKDRDPSGPALKPLKGLSAYMISQTQVRYEREKGSRKNLDKPYGDSGLLLHGEQRNGNLILRKDHSSGNPLKAKYFELPAGAVLTTDDRIVEDSPDTPVQLVKIDDLKFDKKLFIPMAAGVPLDGCFSAEGGVMPACNYILVGDPGIGKSTLVLEYGVHLQKQGKKVARIEAEMTRIDMAVYCQRFPEFGQIPTLYMADYADRDPRKVVESLLAEGWDVIIIDSVAELVEDFREAGLTQRSAESWVIDTMVQHNQGGNKGKHYTSFLVIQQVNKGGNFVGSNKWKHNTTGMIEMRFEKKERFVIVKKNRRGFKFDKLGFVLKGGAIKYNEDLALAQIALEEMDAENTAETQRLADEFARRFNGTGGAKGDLLEDAPVLAGDDDDEEEEEGDHE